MTDPYAAAREYQHHADRHHTQLAGRNHAGMVAIRCQCGTTFDVGYERLRTPAFTQRPYCHPCTTKETPCE
ncbi:hypothetical protein SEA_SQUIDDLY_96 [Gordonia phage Squiddly]|nr:hypothetical protein SEA_SQUIDDLY_96 [Gordonia phage Squiddly]